MRRRSRQSRSSAPIWDLSASSGMRTKLLRGQRHGTYLRGN
jgi:hypothetical protein